MDTYKHMPCKQRQLELSVLVNGPVGEHQHERKRNGGQHHLKGNR